MISSWDHDIDYGGNHVNHVVVLLGTFMICYDMVAHDISCYIYDRIMNMFLWNKDGYT